VRTIERAEGGILQRILDTTHEAARPSLTRRASAAYDTAISKTAWALNHQRRLALVDESSRVLASAQRYDLTGVLDQRRVQICGIGEVFGDPEHDDGTHAVELVERLLHDARQAGAELGLICLTSQLRPHVPSGFTVVPTTDLELRVTESPRRGAPMTLVRGGEDRDLAAIVAMGEARARLSRFHLERDVDFLKYAITRKRLLAGLGSAGARQLQFVIAEEGITAAAYVVLSIVDHSWTIEECGDRDPSGARVGAILQALIAQEPAERRPVIRGWLPPGFVPPQVTIASALPSTEVMMITGLRSAIELPRLSSDEVLYWRSDIF
jgi:hypothetical protein